MKELRYAAPTSLGEAVSLLADAGGEGRVLAGGSDLIDQLRRGSREAAVVVDGKRLPELQRLEYADDGLHIGAAVSCFQIYNSPIVQERYPILAEAASLVGDVKIQHRASMGGNLCNAAPSADTSPAVLCLDGRCVVAGPQGRRELPVEELFTGPGATSLGSNELVVEIVLPPPPAHSSGHYRRFIPRNEMDIAVAGVGSFIALDPSSGACTHTRIALASVAPTPLRAREAEDFLTGRRLDPAALDRAGELAAQAARPITDLRGSAEYRMTLVRVLTRRTLGECLETLGGA